MAVKNFKSPIYSLSLKLVSMLSLGAARAAGEFLAWLMQFFKNDVHRITRLNLQLVGAELQGDDIAALTQRSVSSTLANALEMPVIWSRDNQWLQGKINRVEGEQIMQRAMAEGKGVIAICPHIGNWEVFGRMLPRYGKTTSLYQPPKIQELEQLVREGREKSGATLVPTNQRGMARLLKALRNNEITGILPDQVPQTGSGEFTDFFGHSAYTMKLVYNLIQKTGCRAVLGFALRSGTGRSSGFDIIFREVPNTLYSDDLGTSLQALNELVETAIKTDIAQYQWAYKRFKVQPGGAANPYRRG